MKNQDLPYSDNSKLSVSQSYKTKLRQLILDILAQTTSPLSSLELYNQIKVYKLNCDRSTVYRQLDKLSKENLIYSLDLMDGKKRYELKKQSHHHHLVCNFCKNAICITIPENRLEQLIITPVMENGFVVTSHILEFFGLCKKCNKQNQATI